MTQFATNENNNKLLIDLQNELDELKLNKQLNINCEEAITDLYDIFHQSSGSGEYFENALEAIRRYFQVDQAFLITPFGGDVLLAKAYSVSGGNGFSVYDVVFDELLPNSHGLSEQVFACFSSLHFDGQALNPCFTEPLIVQQTLFAKIEIETGEPMLLGVSHRDSERIYTPHETLHFSKLSDEFKKNICTLHRLKSQSLLFDNSETPMWCEDLSELNDYLKRLRKRGIQDIDKYLEENSKEVYSILLKMPILKINSACLKLFKVASEEEFYSISKKLLGPGAVSMFKKEVAALWRQDESFKAEFNFVNALNETIVVELNIQLPKEDRDYYLVPVSLSDMTEQRRIDKQLNETILRYELVVKGSYGAIWDWDVKTQSVYFSESWAQLRGYTLGELSDSQDEWIRGIHPDDVQRVMAAVHDHFDGKTEVFQEEYRIVCKNGDIRWVADRGVAKFEDDGSVSRMAGSEFDITERRRLDERLRLVASVYENAAEGVMILNRSGVVMDVNSAFEKILGFKKSEVVGSRPEMFSSERKHRSSYSNVWDGLKHFKQWQGEIWTYHKNKSKRPSWLTISCVYDEDTLTHYVGLMTDISEIKRSEQMLYHMAHHDALTGLPNRLLLNERLEQALKHAQRRKRYVAVVFIDLDNFKFVNDGMGHATGDLLLKQVAEVLSETVRAEDTVARIGGDEFLLVLGDIADPENVAYVVEKLMAKVNSKVNLAGQDIRVSTSMGVAVYPNDGEDRSTLIRNADAAMYRAKSSGKMNYQFYTEELTLNAMERMSLEADLHDAIRKGQLQIYYQPQINMEKPDSVSLEALLRWIHPQLGFIPPDKFIPLAEEIGLIEEIGGWVLKGACQSVKQWIDEGYRISNVAVNVSSRQLLKGDFPERVASTLAESSLNAKYLELEITESMLLEDPEFAVRQLEQLKKLGVSIAIDDFGTGYSSLSYLKQLPIDKLKIDKTFISDIGSQDDNTITEVIIGMADRMGLCVVAEGVETDEQEHFLLESGCSNMQGYFYCKPLSVNGLAEFIQAYR
ncbi:GGDEF and EAL domain-containing protein [uncultured Pseudoteredinibacter sp.]|uniref:sensor domain-containing protein n=1 Tax=uncultured Pseudoteredinibacter sp. TaxID=1641701 RepID=UPI00262FDFC8|nr:GGDEF and EAL domain-containing protein [uncultured Pseudoteredinibacter sp.]